MMPRFSTDADRARMVTVNVNTVEAAAILLDRSGRWEWGEKGSRTKSCTPGIT